MPRRIPALLQSRGLLAVTVLAASVLAGCATTTPASAPVAAPVAAPAPVSAVATGSADAIVTAPSKAEEVLRTRAQERWDLLLAEKYESAYAYITPAYRALRTAKDYSGRFGNGGKWMSAKVQSVQCATPERCTVQVLVETLVVASGFRGPIKTTATEIWLQEDGQWWYHQAS